MLISKTATVKWNSKNKKHYVDLGYCFTKMKDEFDVRVEDLTNGSSAIVNVKCDYCGREFSTTWYEYLDSRKTTASDCCSDPKCTGKKASESLINKYGTRNIFSIEEIKSRLIQTNIEKYGCENPFSNEDIKEKIRNTNLNKYGVEYSMQNKDIVKKSQETCLEKYGVTNYGAIYSREHIKELSPTWKGGTEYSRVERSSYEYNNWRRSVFKRDDYTCQCCGSKNGNGKYISLEAHHILNWKQNIDDRYDTNNGITFCKDCHKLFHLIYGKKNNNLDQVEEFINNNKNEKIC